MFNRVIVSTFIGIAALSTVALAADDADRSGLFEGRNDHVVGGRASIQRTDDGFVIALGDDFSLDGAPDPKVGLGSDGAFDPATLLGALQRTAGAQTYAVPEGIDPAKYDEIYIWCEQFAVPLGVATLD